MSTPTPDDKILQLVRAILDAVDARLTTVRQEMATTVQQMEQRHRQVLDALAAFDRRLQAMQAPTPTAPRPTTSPAVTPTTAPTTTPTATPTTAAPTLAPTPVVTHAPAAAAPAGPPAARADQIDLTEVARLVQERLADLQLPPVDGSTSG